MSLGLSIRHHPQIHHLLRVAHSRALARDHVLAGGRIARLTEETIEIEGISRLAAVGDLVCNEAGELAATIVRVSPASVVAMAVRSAGFLLGDYIYLKGRPSIRPAVSWLGSCVDGLGRKISGSAEWRNGESSLAVAATVEPHLQSPAMQPTLRSGVRTIDVFTPLCAGQRMGIFAGSGVGKSTLLNMISERAACDVIVTALVGERRREVSDFLKRSSPDLLRRSVTVVATSDESVLMRSISPLTAMTIAEFFRRQGRQVLLVIDSLTRYAHAVREVLLAGGAAPVARGYPAGVASHLARLVERAGPDPESGGSITGIFSVLVDGDDHNDPVADATRGFLDGHIVLDRAIAERTQYPPVDILKSISRLADRALTSQEHALALHARKLIASFEGSRDLRAIGAYQRGFDPLSDAAIELVPRIYEFLNEGPRSPRDHEPFAGLARIIGWPATNAADQRPA